MATNLGEREAKRTLGVNQYNIFKLPRIVRQTTDTQLQEVLSANIMSDCLNNGRVIDNTTLLKSVTRNKIPENASRSCLYRLSS